MADVSGRTYIDGIDLWTAFGMFIETGSADFLRYAPKKDSITHDWKDAHGIDVDLSAYFFQERQSTLRCAIIADSEADFWLKHDSFIATMTQPGTRRLEITSHGSRSYFIFYKECGSYDQVQPLRGKDEALFGPNKVSAKFSLTVVEPEPQANSSLVYIVDEDGRFIVT